MNFSIPRLARNAAFICLVMLFVSCDDNRARTGGKQGDVGAGGIQTPNPTDSTVHDDSTKSKVDTGQKPIRVD